MQSAQASLMPFLQLGKASRGLYESLQVDDLGCHSCKASYNLLARTLCRSQNLESAKQPPAGKLPPPIYQRD